jgi:TetR/AcrR family transcriptional regulator
MNATSTPERLKAVARRAFAERGYDGASVRLITSRARANLGAVTYHFGSKEALYHAVLEEFTVPLGQRIVALAAAPRPAIERIGTVIEAYYDQFVRFPEFPALVIHELALGRRLPPPIRETLQRAQPALFGLIADGQREGSVRSGPPVPLIMSILSQPFYFAMVRRLVGEIVGPEFERPEFRAMLIQQAVDFVRRGLEPDRRDRA